jgi:peptide/nickel transport system substrate-binding protein
MKKRLIQSSALAGLLLAAAVSASPSVSAADLKGGTLRVGILQDVVNFDPLQFSAVNYPLIRNLYDALIDYTPDGKAIPGLVTAWQIAPDNGAVTLTLRGDVTFTDGTPLTADAVAATLKKAADPVQGKNVYPTMSIVKDWSIGDPHTVTIHFANPVPDRQISDLLQSICVIEPSVVNSVETKVGGTGAYTLAERVLGQRLRLVANPKYWRPGQPVSHEVVETVFSDNEAAAAALESGALDLIYGANNRTAVRLRDSGDQVIQGPAPLTQVLRINTTHGPFRNAKFRQAFNYLMDRQAILKVGYANIGQTLAQAWVPASPAYDPKLNEEYAFNLDKARELLKESGLSQAEMNNWKLMADGGDQVAMAITQLVQSTLTKVGINVQIDLKQGSEFVDALLGGHFDALFGGIGNNQKFPSRVTTNSIYRTVKNPVLGDPNPFPDYVAAIDRVNHTLGSDPSVLRAAYDNLNRALVDASFAIPTNTFSVGLIVASKKVSGFTPDIDDIFVARTIGFTQ